MCSDLDVLLKQARFGKTRAEVAERILSEKLRDLVLQGWMGPDAVTSPLRTSTAREPARAGSRKPRAEKARRGSR